ncbi:MAG: agmatinase [Oscillospiraceae bacterium]|nr:agmatinase [Oscillospiraceae bacterium]
MPNAGHEQFIGCDSTYQRADAAVFGAPFDGTASYRPGARFGPGAIRAESYGIETYSPYQNRDLGDIRVFDGGDLELPFGNAAAALELIDERAGEYLRDGKRPVMLGGEHLVTLGALRAASRAHPDLRVVHFDAHCDMREQYMGERLSHATVMRRAHELVGDGRIYQFGIRSGERRELEFAAEHAVTRMYDLRGVGETVRSFGGLPVYVTVDLDVLDPSCLPGTGTPEPGGATFRELLAAVLELAGANIVGADITELSPHYDTSGISAAAACVTLRELLLIIHK